MRFNAGPAFLAFFEDDFFYYLKVTQNIAAGRGSTFDSIHPTNGYHPLWMMVMVALVRIFPNSRFFYALVGVIIISVLVTFWIVRRLFSNVSQDSSAVLLCAALVALNALVLSKGGMEVVLAIPLAAAVCLFRLRPGFTWDFKNCFVYALLGVFTVLSRLDSILLVGPLILLDVWRFRRSIFTRWNWAALGAGFIPFHLYLASNLLWFSTLLPVSGQAKQLRHHHWLSSGPLHGVFIHANWGSLFIAWLTVLLLLVSIPLLLIRRTRERLPLPVHVLAVMLAFPVLHFLALCALSDWQTWPWYAYSFLVAQIAAFIVLLSMPLRPNPSPRMALQVASAFALVLLASGYTLLQFRYSRDRSAAMYNIYFGAQDLARFSQAHPGIYAKGDGAGIPGYLVSQPIIQLEGLVMDKPYLENVRKERDLREVLRAYGVRYYVSSDAVFSNHCYAANEPAQAGPDSPHMHGLFCMQPVATFHNNYMVERVFDLQAGAQFDAGQIANK